VKKLFPVLLVICALRQLSAADFIVTNTNDYGPGSLRQAIMDANSATTAPRLIKFQIPGNFFRINLASPLPPVPYQTLVDGYTQPGARPNSLTTGTDAILLVEVNASALSNQVALEFGSYGIVRGLVVIGHVSFPSNAAVDQLSGCYIGTYGGQIPAATGGNVLISTGDNPGAHIIGGTTPADRNVIAGSITVTGSQFIRRGGNTIQGNYVGWAADGQSVACGGSVSLNSSENNLVGGSSAGAGNLIAGGIHLNSASGTVVEGNLIGTNGVIVPSGASGLSLSGSISGGSASGPTTNCIVSRNVIAATYAAVELFVSSNNVFRGNFIGVRADGKTRLGNNRQGILFSAKFYRSTNNTVGGPNPGDGNIIMFGNAPAPGPNPPPPGGVTTISDPCSNVILGNSISGTGALGIDLGTAGVTPNDANDADGIQNYPVLTSVVFDGGNARIAGSLNSAANTAFRIELFGNDAADPSGYGQGQSYLGFTNVTTDGNGNASFEVTLPAPASTRAVSSTATGPSGTSEFSASIFAKLLNISTRADVGTDDNIAIAGFIVTGTDRKKVLVRGIGPSMTVGGAPVAGRLADPLLDVRDSSNTLLAENDNWPQSQRAEIQATGLAPTNAKESAVLLDLMPGAYTVQLSGVNRGTGIGLIEVYDLTQVGSELANISTRSFVETGDNVMIAGCIVAPNTGRGAPVLVRGIGPSIPGIANPLPDPMIELYDANGQLLASNDDWKANEAQIRATGLPPGDDHESALVADLAPSNYTLVLRGKGNASGVGLVEVYHLH